jgi:gamma-glutamyltranspeptidase/glutathione hydrolase
MYPGEMSVEARVPEAVRAALSALGHKVRVSGPWTMGSLAAITVDAKTGVLSAGTDPRVDAYAIAW